MTSARPLSWTMVITLVLSVEAPSGTPITNAARIKMSTRAKIDMSDKTGRRFAVALTTFIPPRSRHTGPSSA